MRAFSRLLVSAACGFSKMMYEDKEGKKRFVPNARQLLTEQDTNKVLSMLKSEKLQDMVDCDGTTLLHLSAKFHNKFLVNYLIGEKFDVNAANSCGETPLMSAIGNHTDTDVWKSLLEAGADLWKIKNSFEQSALTIFIKKYRSYGIFKVLMDEVERRCGSVEEVVDVLLSAGFQPYHLFLYKSAEITKLLLEKGCDVNLKNHMDYNNTALHVAAKLNDIDNAKALVQHGADKSIVNADNDLPITIAISRVDPNIELIKLLLPNDADWIKMDHNMSTTFKKCNAETLHFLLGECDVSLDTRDSQGRTALHHLAANQDAHVWRSLEESSRVDANSRDKIGTRPAHLAIKCNNPAALKFLVEAGADVNAVDGQGRTPLFYITHSYGFNPRNIQECVELLMKSGANAQVVLEDGETIVSHLVNRRCYHLCEPILYHLAMIEARGVPLNPIVASHIEADTFTKDCFAKCKEELEDMKTKTLAGNVTYFKLLTDGDERIGKYVRNDEVVARVLTDSGENTTNNSYAYRLLKERFERAVEIGRVRKKARELIAECIVAFEGYCLIVEHIVEYLDGRDLRLIASEC